MASKTIKLWVHRQSDSGKALECSTSEKARPTFWLPKKPIKPTGTVRRNAEAEFEIPEWLWLSHWQLCGREAFEAEKRRKQSRGKAPDWQAPLEAR